MLFFKREQMSQFFETGSVVMLFVKAMSSFQTSYESRGNEFDTT